MEQQAIVFGLLILFVIVAVHDQREASRQCDEYSQYYDKMYYQLPKLEVVNNDEKDLNSHTADTATRKQRTNDTSKPVEAMWGSIASQGGKKEGVGATDDAQIAYITSKASQITGVAKGVAREVWQ